MSEVLTSIARAHEAAVLMIDPLTMVFTLFFFAMPYYSKMMVEKRDHEHAEAMAGDSGGGHGHGH